MLYHARVEGNSWLHYIMLDVRRASISWRIVLFPLVDRDALKQQTSHGSAQADRVNPHRESLIALLLAEFTLLKSQ